MIKNSVNEDFFEILEVPVSKNNITNTKILNINTEDKACYKSSFKIKLYHFLKRSVDICAGMVGILLLLPITLTIAIRKFIRKENTKIFYTQDRIGKNGKLFKLYKFQTMIPDADKYLEKYLSENEQARQEYKNNKKLRNDPRVTELGKLLRKTSIDEFPQFINVLKGDMSLVGPRPYLPREIDDMGISYENIIKVQPGLTGPWQISGRSNLSFEERLRIENNYVENANFHDDMSIIFKTIETTVNKRGAI